MVFLEFSPAQPAIFMAFLLSRIWKFEHFLVVISRHAFRVSTATTTPIHIEIPKCFLNAFSFNFLLGKFNFPSQSLRDIELNYWYFHLHDDENLNARQWWRRCRMSMAGDVSWFCAHWKCSAVPASLIHSKNETCSHGISRHSIEDDRESDGNFKYSEEYRSFVRVCFRFFFHFFCTFCSHFLFLYLHTKNVDGESKFSYVFFSGRLKIFPLPSCRYTHSSSSLCFMYENHFLFGSKKRKLLNLWKLIFPLLSFLSSPFISFFLTFFKQHRAHAHAVEQLTRMFGASSHHTQRVQRIHPVENHPSTTAHDHTRCLSNNCTQESNNKSHGLWPLQALEWRR